jgi:hypothetical protein
MMLIFVWNAKKKTLKLLFLNKATLLEKSFNQEKTGSAT